MANGRLAKSSVHCVHVSKVQSAATAQRPNLAACFRSTSNDTTQKDSQRKHRVAVRRTANNFFLDQTDDVFMDVMGMSLASRCVWDNDTMYLEGVRFAMIVAKGLQHQRFRRLTRAWPCAPQAGVAAQTLTIRI